MEDASLWGISRTEQCDFIHQRLNLIRERIFYIDNLICVFGSNLDIDLLNAKDFKKWDTMDLGSKDFKTKVLMVAQVVIRCEK
jgi:hypothetical protein